MGWVRALHIADSFFLARFYRNILIVNAEFTVYENGLPNVLRVRSDEEIGHSFPALTIGEAATATVVHHEGDQPPDRPFAIRVGAEQLRHVSDRRGLGLDPPAFGGHAGTFRLPALGVQILLVSREGGVGIGQSSHAK
jgi:hypothetical protein